MTFLSPLIFLGMSFLIGYLSSINKDEATKIAVYDQGNILKSSLKSDKETAYTDLSSMPFNVAKDTASKNYEGLLFIPKTATIQDLKSKVEFISDESASVDFISDIEEVVDSILTQDNFKTNNLDISKIENAKVESSLKLSKYSGDASLKGINEIKIGLGFLFGYLIMMFIIIYGNFVMRSVIEEKTNRIIEIVISSVKPFQLMMGKIIGIAMVGLTQFLIWVGLTFVIIYGVQIAVPDIFQSQAVMQQMAGPEASMVSQTQITNINAAEMPSVSVFTLIDHYFNVSFTVLLLSFLFYFIFGYLIYAALFAAVGSAVDNETDSQQFTLPVTIPLLLTIMLLVPITENPNGPLAFWMSMIPLTSPVAMLIRLPSGVPLVELLSSMAICVLFFVFCVWFAAKIYRVGILMYGKKVTYRELFKWLRY